jgi:hypothetical protein
MIAAMQNLEELGLEPFSLLTRIYDSLVLCSSSCCYQRNIGIIYG